MTSPRQNDIPDRVRNAEETLRLVAKLPALNGLAERVQARLAATPPRTSLLGSSGFSLNGWMLTPVLRGCAAAAIVLLVTGGGFAILSRVQPSPSAKAVEQPARIGNSGSFSTGGAMRTPDTLKGPVLAPSANSPQPNVIAPKAAPQSQAPLSQPRPVTPKKKAAAAK
jgi:hypothetical protein